MDWYSKINDKAEKSNSKIIKFISKLNGKEITDFKKIKREDKCSFKCECGIESTRTIICIVNNNMYCDYHSNEIKQANKNNKKNELLDIEIKNINDLEK